MSAMATIGLIALIAVGIGAAVMLALCLLPEADWWRRHGPGRK